MTQLSVALITFVASLTSLFADAQQTSFSIQCRGRSQTTDLGFIKQDKGKTRIAYGWDADQRQLSTRGKRDIPTQGENFCDPNRFMFVALGGNLRPLEVRQLVNECDVTVDGNRMSASRRQVVEEVREGSKLTFTARIEIDLAAGAGTDFMRAEERSKFADKDEPMREELVSLQCKRAR